MKKYKITVLRIGYAFKEIEVEADSQEEAKAAALEVAGGEEFSENNAEYEINNIQEEN
jgi:hypothetical protein